MPPVKGFNVDVHVLTWIKANLRVPTVFSDGTCPLLTRMMEDTIDSFRKYSPKEAAALGKHMRTWQRMMGETVGPYSYFPPKPSLDLVVTCRRPRSAESLQDLPA